MRKKLRSFVLREPVRTPVEISRSSTDDLRDEDSDLSDLLKINYKTMRPFRETDFFKKSSNFF